MTDAPKSGGAAGNVRRLRTAIDEAKPVRRGKASLPDNCPVTPLGKTGLKFWYLDEMTQLISLAPRDHGRQHLAALFGRKRHYLVETWPRMDKNGEPTKAFSPELVADALMTACAEEGVWNPQAKVRGRGAWRGADGDLVLHLGTCLWINGRLGECGLRGGDVYPVLEARPFPAREPQAGGADGPAAELLAMLKSWAWKRPKLDPLLMLGWVCASMLGGALAWRPGIWLTGDRGTGKSTLQALIKDFFGDGGIISVSDTTAAGIRQRVRHDALPVALDEIEAKANDPRTEAVIELARQASSGGVILRGGADHEGQDFTARFSILYSSILIPPLRSQDRSRLAILDLQPLPATAAPPRLHRDAIGTLGQRLLRRMADVWPRLPAVLEMFRYALMARKFDARGADQYGTLLACAWLALHDEAPLGDEVDDWVDDVNDGTKAERAEDLPDWQRCLTHLLTTPAQLWREGKQEPIGAWVRKAREAINDVPAFDGDGKPGDSAAGLAILSYGLRWLEVGPKGRGSWYLAVANQHRGLEQVFERTHWAAASGTSGVWAQALARAPGAGPSKGAVRFGAAVARAVLIPHDIVTGQEGEGEA